MKDTKYKIYIYGAGFRYNELMSYLVYYKDKFEIMGIITTSRGVYDVIDGFKCIELSEANIDIADYIIIAVDDWESIRKNLAKAGAEDKILRSHIFKIPNFDFERYISLKNSNVTILSNYCLGGHLYRQFGLKELSPTINMYCSGLSYIEFLKNYEYYLGCDMYKTDRPIEHLDGSSGQDEFWPHGVIGNDKPVEWILNHDYEEGISINNWNRRRKRVNLDNVVAIMIIQSDAEAYEFQKINIKKKIGFYYKDLGLKKVICIKEWPNIKDVIEYDSHFPFFVNNYMRDFVKYVPTVDWLKFLLGEDDYIRKI